MASYVRVTSKRQVTFPKGVLEGLKAQAGDLLEVTFTGESIELRPTKRTFLDLMGSVQVPGPQDFNQARQDAIHLEMREVADEGNPD